MRTGINPQKYKSAKNKQYFHRILIPVHIPNLQDAFYTEALQIFDMVLKSLFKSINTETTAITILNNNSQPMLEKLVNSFDDKIDKYVKYSCNKGKVYAVLNEARGCYEPFVTIADADVLFVEGWEQEVFEIFKVYPKAGVVAPLPSQNSAFVHNSALFFDKYFLGGIKYDNVVDDTDCDLFIEGLGNSALHNRQNRSHNWKQKQYYLNGEKRAIVGAGHFVATYKSQMFRGENDFPNIVFKNGFESKFIDILSDKKGLYRLSTTKTFAYHIGNKLDDNCEKLVARQGQKLEKILIVKSLHQIPLRLSSYYLRSLCFRLIKKLKKL